MKLPSLARAGRTGWLASLFITLVAGSAFAAGDPPPDPTLPFIEHYFVGVASCDTCAPITCPGEPARLTISGHLQAQCYSFRGIRAGAPVGTVPVRIAEFVVDTCRAACPDLIAPYTGTAYLPPQGPGFHSYILRVAVRTCPDSSVVVDSSAVEDAYEVQPVCEVQPPPPPPIDSLVRTFVSLRTVPEHPCAGDSVTLQLVKNGCPPCFHLVSFGPSADSSSLFAGVAQWTPVCNERTCVIETLSAPMGRLAAGTFQVSAPMTVIVHRLPDPDTTISFRLPLTFDVSSVCGTPPPGPCVVREMASDVHGAQCALTLPPGGSGNVPLYYSSELPMAGLQGVIEAPAPFLVGDIRVASELTGVHLSRQRVVGGMRWVVFTDPGVTLAPGGHQHLLDVTIDAYPVAPSGSSGLMSATITLAAGPDGGELPLCLRESFAIVATRLCIAGEAAGCDVNHDGRLDVRDLVRMAGCLRHDLVDTTGACVDCDSSGVFDISDIYCCAVNILRGPLVPPDSVRQDGNVAVSLGPVFAQGANRIVHVHVTGAHTLGATMLRLDYPSDRWQAGIPVQMDGPARPVDADWYPLLDIEDPGHVHLGGIRLGDSGADEFDVEIVMQPTATPLADDQLVVAGADLAARDGGVLTPRDPLPVLSLTAPAPPQPGPGQPQTLALSAPRPNPFTDQTTFVVSLPASAQIDLAVHDLAGRRIATLANGLYASGQQTFHWDGAGARGGMYYVRLRVNGQVFTSRVVLLRNSH